MDTGVNAASSASEGFDVWMDADWRGFRAALADALTQLRPGERAMVGARPGMAFGAELIWSAVWRGTDTMIATVPSNTYLPDVLRMSREHMAGLRGLGLRRAHSGADYTCQFPAAHVDRAATILVAAMRECFGVLHPSCLVVTGVTLEGADGDGAREASPIPLGVLPTDHQHLTGLVSAALDKLPETLEVARTDQGWVVWNDESMTTVSISPQAPVVVLRSAVLRCVERPNLARQQVNRLNRAHGGITFTFEDDALTAEVQLFSYPFAALHLLTTLPRLLEVTAEAARQLLPRIGGESFAGTPADESRAEVLARSLVMLLTEGTVSTKQVAGLCEHDPALVKAVMEQIGDDDADWQGLEAQAGKALALLRRALRLVSTE
ncbi:TY-Chap domain-containing protein [Propionibacteriaceae bacterium Y1923]